MPILNKRKRGGSCGARLGAGQAVILSAGLGTRLRPLTDTLPKSMIPILGKPLLEWNIENFKKHGVTEFFINLHYLPDVIENYFGDGSKWGVKITYNFEPVIMGTAGGVKGFEDKLNDEFFLIYGDMFSAVDYTKMEKAFREKTDAIGMQRVGLVGYRPDIDLADVDESGRIVKIYAKPHAVKPGKPYSLRGVFILKKKILSCVPPNTPYEIGKQLLPDIIAKGERFYGYECEEYSKGIDTIEKYKEVEEYLKNNPLK